MSEADCVRVDVWLWRARFFKTRTLATRFVEKGSIRLSRNGQTLRIERASLQVRPGDVLTLSLRSGIRRLTVNAIGTRRGPPAEAQTLYEAMLAGVGESDA